MEPRRTTIWRGLGIALAAVVLVASFVWRQWPDGGDEPDEPVGGVAVAGVAAPPPAVGAPPAEATPAEPPLDLAALPEPVQRFLAATPYPRGSGRLTAQHEDLLRPNRRHERPHPIPDTLSDDPSEVVSVLLTADHWHYEARESVNARLRASRGEEPIPISVVHAVAVRQGRSGFEGDPVPFSFFEHELEQRAEIPLYAHFDDHHGQIVLRVWLEYAPDRRHLEELRVFYTPESRIPGRLTGELSDEVVDGNLRLHAGIDVFEPGFYRIDANLYGPADEPVAFASFKGQLGAGSGSVPLEVYGKVLRDAGVAGPWTVRQVRGYRFLEGGFPDREQLVAAGSEHRTHDWPLEAFRDDDHLGEHELHMVELMLEDLERGIPLEVPGLPGAGDAVGPRPPDDDLEPTAAVDPETTSAVDPETTSGSEPAEPQ